MVACKEMGIFQEKCYILKYFQVSFTSKGAQAGIPQYSCIGQAARTGILRSQAVGGQPKRASSLSGVYSKSKIDRKKSLSTKISYK